MLGKHGRDDALVSHGLTGAHAAQRVLDREAHPIAVPRSRQQPPRYGDRGRADVEARDADVGALFGGEEAQHTMSRGELEHRSVGRKPPQELIAKQRDVRDHRGPEGVNEYRGPHVGHHVAFVLVDTRDDFRHRFGSVLARPLVDLLRLRDAQAVPGVAEGRLIECLLAVGVIGPARERVQNPRAQLLVRAERGTRARGKQFGATLDGAQKSLCGFHSPASRCRLEDQSAFAGTCRTSRTMGRTRSIPSQGEPKTCMRPSFTIRSTPFLPAAVVNATSFASSLTASPSVCTIPSNLAIGSSRLSTNSTLSVRPCVGAGMAAPLPSSSVQSGVAGKSARRSASASSQVARARQMAEVKAGWMLWRGCKRFSSLKASASVAANSATSPPAPRSRNRTWGEEQAC